MWRERAVSSNALDHSAIRAGPGIGERQCSVSNNALEHPALDHWAMGQALKVVRDGKQSVAMP